MRKGRNTKKVDVEDLGRVTSPSSSSPSRNMRRRLKPSEFLNQLLHENIVFDVMFIHRPQYYFSSKNKVVARAMVGYTIFTKFVDKF